MPTRRHAVAAVAALALAGGVVAGCGDDDEETARPASTGGGSTTAPEAPASGPAKAAATVNIKDFKFGPSTVTIKQGGKVTWINADTAPHNAENTGEGGPVDFKTKTPLAKADKDTVTFSKPGTYKYYCIYHRFMEADVVVK